MELSSEELTLRTGWLKALDNELLREFDRNLYSSRDVALTETETTKYRERVSFVEAELMRRMGAGATAQKEVADLHQKNRTLADVVAIQAMQIELLKQVLGLQAS